MPDRVPSDHDAVETVRAPLSRAGSTRRPRIELPEGTAPAGEVVRVVLGGEEYHARIERALDGGTEIRGAYDNARLARVPGDGENRLPAWVETAGVTVGNSVLVDVVVEDFKYGVRAPGERVVYTATEPLTDGLADIARDLDG
ncbi:hypothetical protein BRC83_02095 [Halobacteriales archaeon QS_1_68_17]|nr:MAG: hypothetical protein BRC83_02095 [Halobacteriales archaeon QS_1_68_17]